MTTINVTRVEYLTAYSTMTIHAPDEAATLLASGCGCTEEHALGAAAFAVADPDAPAGQITWSGVIGMESELTGDGRLIEANALRWENLPIPLRHAPSDIGAHGGAVVVGRILTIERGAGGKINATGDFDATSVEGLEAARQVGDGLTVGVSMDLDSVSFEIRVAKELLGEMPITEEEAVEERDEELNSPEDEEGRVTVITINADDEVMVTTDARIRAATIVAIPAFAGANIALDSPLSDPQVDEDGNEIILAEIPLAAAPALVAGGFPQQPPQEWFDNPSLNDVTPLTVTEDGRVFGHLAVWGTCHTAYTGQCVEPPHSPSGYAYFRTGAVLTAEGSEIPTGVITLDTLHANDRLSPAQTLAHYEHTGRGTVDVSAGEDVFGIWVAGALRPGVTPDQIRALRASPLSGDWRRIGGSLELVAALAVNVPGFPVPRPKGLVASGVMQSLVASGMVAPQRVIAPGHPGALSTDDLRYLKRLAARERQADVEEALGVQSAADALAARVRATRVEAMARRLRS